ncbi:MAG: sugar phosphate nucleotidyltransferase [Candidatus Wolfebacteria bacterium]|nr:sugar phosphate nucleotidyltransferase [Candidatus Wolfebacteria bacterium]
MRQQKPFTHKNLKDIDVVILCGGKGERLKSVINDRPKVLAPMGDNKAFLDIIIDNLLSKGFKRIILSVGYLKDQIINRYENYENAEILFSEESAPLGTGGAIKNTEFLISGDHFMVMNGDSFFDIDFFDFFDMHLKNDSLLSIALTEVDDVSDYGSVELDNNNKISRFKGKNQKKEKGLVNAGIYLVKKDIFKNMPKADSFSLEHDLIPKVLELNCYGFKGSGRFIDIGTPERYEKAVIMFKNDL